MGVTINCGLPHLLLFKQKYPDFCSGSLLALGRQDVYFTFKQLMELAATYNTTLEPIEPNTVSNRWTGQESIDDISLFKALGFTKIDALDFVDREGANFVHDLNIPVPASLKAKWDVIYDGGTLEHVFDIKCAFANIHNMLKVNGIIVHELPVNGFVDHGFWQLSPTALLDCYSANDYQILEQWVWTIQDPGRFHAETPRRFIYDPELFAHLSIGRFPAGMAGVTFLARKKSDTEFQSPVQGFYRSHWGMSSSGSAFSSISGPGGVLNLEYIDLNSRPSFWLRPIAELLLTLGRAFRCNRLLALGERLWNS
jgi:SAM-dependent methyltransferase